MSWKERYLKYKQKYLELSKQSGGGGGKEEGEAEEKRKEEVQLPKPKLIDVPQFPLMNIAKNLTYKEISDLKTTHPLMYEKIHELPLCDMKTVIPDLRDWRLAFPKAICANISNQHQYVDADFVHLRGIRTLNMSVCDQAGITDAAFAHLAGSIQTLNMSNCHQVGITDAAFAHLRGIQKLDISYCRFRRGPNIQALRDSGTQIIGW